ncbi:solute carrier family 25 member 45 [Aplysia californica]|uniref:Solute carrier family 25 member 45 n=1 Tax=Aplysia californica TaxID=6500 RepID=A0ABM0JT65_APLCA|nr:solute carrier family 25 member 45 [Aplysia californica]
MSETNIINDYLAGAIGGCAGVVVGHPLDTIKVQIQTQEYGGKYASMMDCIRTVQAQNLSKGYFRGLSWPLFSYGVINSVFFGTYGVALKAQGCEEIAGSKPQYGAIAIASAVATLPQLLIMCPVEVIKVTLQSQIPHTHNVPKTAAKQYFSGPMEAATSIIKTSGYRGMYRGFCTQIIRDTPASVAYLVIYSFLQYESQKRMPSFPSQLGNFISGGISGVLSWMIIMPFDVIKSKLQADPNKQMYEGFWDCTKKVYSAGGLRAFIMGFVPMSIRAFPVNAVTLMVYSESLLYLNRYNS